MRKSNKFKALVVNKEKKIQNVHILFMYDTLLQKEDDLKQYINKFKEIFEKNRFKVEINTIFDVIYFVNPSSINTRRLSNIISELKEENEKSAATIAEIKKQNENNLLGMKADYDSKIEEITKLNEKERQEMNSKIEEITKSKEKDILEMNLKIEEITKSKEKERQEMNSKIEDITKSKEKEKLEMKAEYDSKLEEINLKFDKIIKINEYLSNKVKELEKTISNSNQNKENNNPNLIDSIFLSVNTINNIIKNYDDIIDNFQVSKRETIYLICKNGLYIINQNLFKFIEGYRKVVLPLNNGNLLTTKNRKILIYSNNNFEKATETINMNCYPRQIIVLHDENKFLYLSEDSKIILIQTDSGIKTEIIYENKENSISSIISVNNFEIAIIFNNRIIMFYNIEKKEEIKILKLSGNGNINLLDNSLIANGYLYIALIDSIFKIDINNREINKKLNFGFSKIYSFNNDIFGINKNCVYKINDGNNNNNEQELILDDILPIRSLYKVNKKQIIFCTEKQIKFHELAKQNRNNY